METDISLGQKETARPLLITDYKHCHLIGIGGIGMSCIAQILLRKGVSVSGSDLKESKITEELKKLGARITISHDPANIPLADAVVYSSAIRQDNPEIQEAARRGLPLLRRAEALAGLMSDDTVIAVTGSHGKTTTASLISCLLIQAGLSPTIAVGGVLKDLDTNAYLGSGKFFVAEADESDGSFLCYRPKYPVVTNIDYEHMDYYGNFQNALDSFASFLGRTRPDGCAFVCADDINLRKIMQVYHGRHISFGLGAGADIYPLNISINGLSSEFECFYRNKFLARFSLALGGLHNISNALAVIALGLELGIGLETIRSTLRDYRGAKRRLEIKFSDKDYQVLDDYGHHPSEIKATLTALRNMSFKRMVVVFQPHRYTRTSLLMDDFTRSFGPADYLVITDIYSAGEQPIAGVDSQRIVAGIKRHSPDKQAIFMPRNQVLDHILEIIRPGDLILTLGAGDITRVSDELLEILKRKS